jgi:hypothetical protein
MFPYDLDVDTIDNVIKKEDKPADYEVIFQTDKQTGQTTGTLTGNKITGIPAIKQWIFIALQVARYRFPQYSWDYGNELQTLVGKQNLKEVSIKAEAFVKECLFVYPFITAIEDFECEQGHDFIKCYFTVQTTYGTIKDMNVYI